MTIEDVDKAVIAVFVGVMLGALVLIGWFTYEQIRDTQRLEELTLCSYLPHPEEDPTCQKYLRRTE